MKALLSVICLGFLVGSSHGTCPPTGTGQYFQLGPWCYIAQGISADERANFTEANEACKALDPRGKTGTLAVISQVEVQSLLTAILGFVFDTNSWIGLSQGIFHEDEPGFQWVDKSEFRYQNWAPFQPDGFGLIPGFGSDCVELFNDRDHPGRWYDVPCSKKNAYICQVKALDLEIHNRSSECLANYTDYFSSCFRLYTSPETFDEAEKVCLTDSPVDSFLATADSGFDNAFMEYMLYQQIENGSIFTNNAWIGLRREPVTNQLKWLDGYSVTFTKWSKYDPNDNKGRLNCTVMEASEEGSAWFNRDCGREYPFFCKSRIGGHHPPTAAPIINGTCPDGWESHGTDCYLFKPSSTPLNRNRAQYDCFLNFGSRLVSIHTAQQNEFIRKRAADAGYATVWIGLERDYEVRNSFRWEDDSTVDYDNWAPEEPGVHDEQKCVRMGTRTDGLWKTVNCGLISSHVCTMPQYQEDDPPKSTVCSGTPGWASFGDYCYLVSDPNTHQATWNEAQQQCNRQGGYLASITSQPEQDFINSMRLQMSPRFWIGLMETSDNTYEWSDDVTSDFRFWDEGQPNDFAGEEKCVEMNMMLGGKWNNLNCGVKENYICKKFQNTTSTIATPTETPISGGCPDGWVQAKAKCLKVFSGAKNMKTRMDAAAECRKYNDGSLAVILNVGEQAMLTTLMEPSNQTLWIGLSNIGATDQFHWSDGSPLDYTNWFRDETPINLETICVVMRNDTLDPGRWQDIPCETKSNFACTTDASPDFKVQPAYLHSCDQPGYVSFHGGCFRYHTTSMSFDDAVAFCRSDGNTIATIRDDYDGALTRLMLYLNDSNHAWIGLRKDEETHAFRWLDSWPFLYTNWLAGKPSGTNAVGHGCVAVDTKGFWSDTACSEKQATICKNTALPPSTAPPYVTGYCLDDWIAWGSHCYLLVSKSEETESGTWGHASSVCDYQYACYLSTVHSEAENTFLTEQAKAVGGGTFWLGMSRDFKGNLQWEPILFETREPVDYVNWETADSTTGPDNCVGLKAGKWGMVNCTSSAGYVCKRDQIALPTSKPTSDGTLSPGALAGLIVGIILGASLLVIGLAVIWTKFRRSNTNTTSFGVRDTSPIVSDAQCVSG
ncbi:macrophage mannose receptor 1-like isoform X1 [Acanthaster planci]|uniref:Macrophage mannose receptor 1-like isoform X1 n=1 Tax=Acanthaster planci TaxID=133434 RepID=A0A8B7Y9S8_ACAPL|nr:macrophage mannose receptor 1-like isoform X1 [Acanthaster planci]XP_022088457.1 macrophage mannose receptor 1-like isoform X1 [Acanthaster planci]XP_022088458.1 macrophage mannose receptor 1-like isoform X1 [Acanthaster planci]XP_022088459.1 macrophage mannose receptor 1-like isoform X1 [Acanthaster planci]